MRRGTDLGQRLRRPGLVASILAVMAIGVTVLADTRDVGFGQSVTRVQQRSLLRLAALLCAAQTIAYLINRRRDKRDWRRHKDRLSSAAPGATNKLE
jgi:inactivated superfamily I helicase